MNSNSSRRKTLEKPQEVGVIGHWATGPLANTQPRLPALRLSASVERSKSLNMTRPGKSVWDKCDHSALCASSKMWWLHTRMRHNGKWRSGRQIISRMNAFFRNHYSDVPMRATTKRTPQQTDASGGETGKWGRREERGREEEKKVPFTELAR